MTIIENVKNLREEIADVCSRAGRNESDITIVAASKYVGAEGILEAHEAGIRHFGENRVQDALDKIEKCPDSITWHFIGHLQRNKVTKVVGNFAFIHSVDSFRLAEKIQQVAEDNNIVQKIMLEVNISGEDSKFGLESDVVMKLVDEVISQSNVELTGLMTMAPFTDDEAQIRPVFRGLRRLRDDIEIRFDKKLPNLSMGMTNDWRIAIEEGATHLRIGSAIFK